MGVRTALLRKVNMEHRCCEDICKNVQILSQDSNELERHVNDLLSSKNSLAANCSTLKKLTNGINNSCNEEVKPNVIHSSSLINETSDDASINNIFNNKTSKTLIQKANQITNRGLEKLKTISGHFGEYDRSNLSRTIAAMAFGIGFGYLIGQLLYSYEAENRLQATKPEKSKKWSF